MQFEVQEDVEAPIEFVFGEVTDFVALERQALRRGAEVRRLDGGTAAEEGAAWQIRFEFRGRQRDLRADLVEYEPSERFAITSATGGLDGLTVVELVALSRSRTRVTLTTGLKATSLPSRLLLQSLKLGRSSLDRRLERRIAAFAVEIADRWKRRAAAQVRTTS